MPFPTYTEPDIILDATSDADAVARCAGIARAQDEYEAQPQLFLTDLTGVLADDLSGAIVTTTDCQIVYDSTVANPASLALSLTSDVQLRWGSQIVAVYQLLRSRLFNAQNGYDPESWHRFPLGRYVVTSPGLPDMDSADYRGVTGYGIAYLLQNEIHDTLWWDTGTKFKAILTATFRAAGLLASGADLSTVCDFPGNWPAKASTSPMTYTLDGSDYNFLQICNDALKASGCQPLRAQPNGRWLIAALTEPTSQPNRWEWYGSGGDGISDDDLDSRVVQMHASAYRGDVYNIPNQWRYVAGGIPVQPNEGAGLYTVNNTTIGPSDQVTTGTIRRVNRSIDAVSQDDMVSKANVDINAELSSVEQLDLTTTSWPAAGHFDVFTFHHAALPAQPYRKVQAQSWTLPLFGGPMSWHANVAVKLV